MSLSSAEHTRPRNPSGSGSASTSSSTVVSHIRDLLPFQKHAVFHVKLVIHQLQSVPLISGAFRVNWKFRHLQAVNSAGRPLGLGRALALKLDGQKRKRTEQKRDIKGKGKQMEHDDDDAEDNVEDENDVNISPPVFPIFPGDYPDSPQSTHIQSKQSTQSAQSIQSIQSTSSSTSTSLSNFNLTPALDATPTFNISSPSSSPEPGGIDYRTEARGHTPFLPLHDYQVDFESEVNVAVQLSIERDSLALLPSELKLTVMQRVIPNDPEAPLHPRLGHVQVNLAEYVGAGAVTRNYLLRRSKVNAMLNMTITMTQLSGETSHHAPPLRKEEIKAGISDFLTMSSARLPLSALGQYVPSIHVEEEDDPWLASELGRFGALGIPLVDEPEVEGEQEQGDTPDSTPDLPGAQRQPRKRWRVRGGKRRMRSAEGQGKMSDPTLAAPPKSATADEDTKSQKHRQQLHPTEALIEAIFNPYPSASDAVSPFTYYAPPEPEPAPLLTYMLEPGDALREGTGNGTDGTSRGSFDSSLRAGASEQGYDGRSTGGHSGGSGSGNGSMNGRGPRWWQRRPGVGSRPVTPASVSPGIIS